MKLPRSSANLLRRAGLGFCAALVVTSSAFATWSIVAVNNKTGEVCIASATCLEDFYLPSFTAVVRVGKGVAACQSLIDDGTVNRVKIWNMMENGFTPSEMLVRLLGHDNHASNRQYGIVTLDNIPVTYTGPLCGEARYGISGQIDDIRYAIQGNVLTGIAVAYYAENALVNTQGDLSTRVMAAMEAARSMGGDGRCSCDLNVPWHCGAPPAGGFTFSAYTSFIILARMGDQDGICQDGYGCANGNYYCYLTAVSDSFGAEPVLALEGRFQDWRANQRGFADQLLSTVDAGAQSMPADGVSRTTVDVQLRDIDGHPVIHQPALLSVTRDYDGPAVARVGQITDHGGGHFSFVVSANGVSGPGKWKLEVTHGDRTILLWPELSIRIDPLTELHSGYDQVSASTGASIPLVLNSSLIDAGAPYIVLGSASGTSPGQMFDGLALPLNGDALFQASLLSAGFGHFPGTAGSLSGGAPHAQGNFVVPPMLLATYIGRHFDWCGVIHGPSPHVTNLAGFDVVP